MNALAWYHEHYQKDYVTAVELWEQADLLNSHDAAFNLGVLYAQGRYPGKPADQVCWFDLLKMHSWCDKTLALKCF